MTRAVMQVEGLRVQFRTSGAPVTALDGVSLEIFRGERVAVVGESGCGKTTLALSILRLLPEAGRVTAGSVHLEGLNLLEMSDDEVRQIRGKDLAMTFQDPMTSLNPLMRVGAQIQEAMTAQGRATSREASKRVVPLMARVAIPAPAERARDYPHQFSGGMRQRSMVAMGIANDPAVLVADEPTTALDTTVQRQIVDLLGNLNSTLGMAVVLITHNMGLVSQLCERVVVMYAGRVIEDGPVDSVLRSPQHPYTWSLLGAVPGRSPGTRQRLVAIPGAPPAMESSPGKCTFEPRCRFAVSTCKVEEPDLIEVGVRHHARCWVLMRNVEDTGVGGLPPAVIPVHLETTSASGRQQTDPHEGGALLEMDNISKHFPGARGRPIRAVDGVSLHIAPGETLGLIGESGCGKSTIARLITRLLSPTEGSVKFKGKDLASLNRGELREVRRQMQMIFQDPFSSLDQRLTVGAIVGEPLVNFRVEPKRNLRRQVESLLELVGLAAEAFDRHPVQFSGGQRQRIGIARALALRPSLVVCDEPVSSLDVSVQAQIVNLLVDLQAQLSLAYLFISHDLALIQHVADRVAVMYLGKIVETAPTRDLYENPQHPYTRALLESIPRHEDRRPCSVLAGEVPSSANPPSGCRFHPRCPIARTPGLCDRDDPSLESHGRPDHLAACHFAEEPPGCAPAKARSASEPNPGLES